MSKQNFWRPALPDTDFDAFIFDCDGTLADTMPAHYTAWCRALGGHAHFLNESVFYSLGGVPTARIVEILNERHGLSLPVEELVVQKENLFESLSETIQPIDGVVEVARAHHLRKPMAVASGGHRHIVTRTLRTIGVHDLFQAIVCAEDYTHGKPNPEPFLVAAKRLGVRPERCLVFEDTEPGEAAARAAGMDCILVPRERQG